MQGSLAAWCCARSPVNFVFVPCSERRCFYLLIASSVVLISEWSTWVSRISWHADCKAVGEMVQEAISQPQAFISTNNCFIERRKRPPMHLHVLPGIYKTLMNDLLPAWWTVLLFLSDYFFKFSNYFPSLLVLFTFFFWKLHRNCCFNYCQWFIKDIKAHTVWISLTIMFDSCWFVVRKEPITMSVYINWKWS